MVAYVVWIVTGVLTLWHIYGAAVASWHIARSEFFAPWQKTMQYLIAWLLPLIGVALILNMLGPEVRKRRPGWFPLLEPLVLASFGISGTEVMDSMASGELGSESSTDSPSGVDASD
jgi:hypothetical protein